MGPNYHFPAIKFKTDKLACFLAAFLLSYSVLLPARVPTVLPRQDAFSTRASVGNLWKQALRKEHIGNYKEAQETIGQLLDRIGDNTAKENVEPFFLKLSSLAYKQHDPQQAIKYLDELLTIKPDSVKGLSQRGDLYLTTKQYDKAIPDFTMLIESQPCISRYQGFLAFALIRNGDWDDAVYAVERLLQLHPRSFSGLFNKAHLAFLSGDDNTANTLYAESIQLMPNLKYAQQKIAYDFGYFMEQGWRPIASLSTKKWLFSIIEATAIEEYADKLVVMDINLLGNQHCPAINL